MYWQILRWPLRTTALIAIGIYSLVAIVFSAWAQMNVWVAVLVMSLGLPIWYAVFGMLSLYARKLVVKAATGLVDGPFTSEFDINPFEHREALHFAVAHLLVFLLWFFNGPVFQPVLILPAVLFPFLWLGVVLEDSLFDGLHPRKMLIVLKGLNLFYGFAILLASGSVGYLHYALLYANGSLNIIASALVFLLANALFGGLLYACRGPLELWTEQSPEQTRAAEQDARQRAFDDLFHTLHTHVNAGNFATAIERLEAFRTASEEDLDPELHERLFNQPDKRLCLEHAVGYLQRLADRQEPRKAWTLLKRCLALDERFRPTSDDTLLLLTRAAGREDAGLVDRLLTNFGQAYPDSPLIPDALFRRARICIELLNKGTEGFALLMQIEDEHPDFAATDRFQLYRARLKLR
jgi:hypothetical protein